MIMSLALIVVKLCGMIYKVALTRVYGLFGAELASFGTGLFNNAYEIYVPLFTIATAGLPIAVSRLVSESNAQKRYKDINIWHFTDFFKIIHCYYCSDFCSEEIELHIKTYNPI